MTTLPTLSEHQPQPQAAVSDVENNALLHDVHPLEPESPKYRTPARLRTCFLRHFARSGSLVDAAARTGVSVRTVRRWRTVNWSFKKRYEATVEERREMLEDRAMQRAFSIDRRAVFYRGQPVAVAERFNDNMLMRVLLRFDRLRERDLARPPHKREWPADLTKLSDMELVELAGIKVPAGMSPFDVLDAAHAALVGELEKRMPQESAFSGQVGAPTTGQ